MPYITITAPTVEPVTLAQVKLSARIDDTELDSLITDVFIPAAREMAEHETGRALCTQTRELVLDTFPDALVLRGNPIQSVTSVRFLDTDGNEVELDPQDYQVDTVSEPGYVIPAYGKTWPETYAVANAVRVRYVCGFGDADDVPAGIKQWIVMAAATMVAQAETMSIKQATALPDRFWQSLLDKHRIYA